MSQSQIQTPLQHQVEIGPDPHGAAEVVAALVRNDQRTGAALPAGLPPDVVYEEPRGADRIPAPATVAREGTAACGAFARAQASKEKATHVGVCRATGPDGKPVHHAFLVAAAKPGEAPLVTGPDGKSLGHVDMKRVRDPSRDRGMNCGCHVPEHLYQDASFAPIRPETLHPEHPTGAASALVHAPPAARAAAGGAYQGAPRAHAPETPAGRAVAEAAALAARAVTPPPGHEPRPAHDLHPHPAVPHHEADAPHTPHRTPPPEHLERMTGEFVGALHTIAAGQNPHPLPEDPVVTEAHAEAARKMVGTLAKVAKATPAHELDDDPARQAQILAVVPEHAQREIRSQILDAAANLEHIDSQRPENDAALAVAAELDALLPGVLPGEVGDALRRRRAKRRAALNSIELSEVGSEPDASLASALALAVALDSWHVGCPWDGRRAPPPDYPERPSILSVTDAPVAGLTRHTRDIGEAGQTAASLAAEFSAGSRPGWLGELQAANGGRPASESAPLAVGTSWQIPRAWWPAEWQDPPVGHGGGHGGHGHGHGGGRRGGYGSGYGSGYGGGGGWSGLDFIDCGPLVDEIVLDVPILGSVMDSIASISSAILPRSSPHSASPAAEPHMTLAEQRAEQERRERAEQERRERAGHGRRERAGHGRRERAGHGRREHGEPWRRGLVSGPRHARGWFGPETDDHGAPLVIGRSHTGDGAYTWGGVQNGWIPTATWLAGHLGYGGRFVYGYARDPLLGGDASDLIVGGMADKDESIPCRLITEGAADAAIGHWRPGWDYRGLDRVIHDRHGAGALRRYWRDAEFRRAIDRGAVVDGWDLAALYEILDPPVAGWWSSFWGRGRERHDRHHWWRRDRGWDRGWGWWGARLPASHPNHAWFRRFHEDPDFRRRAEAGEIIDGLDLATVLAWAQSAVPGSVPDVVVGAYPYRYRPAYRRPVIAPVVVAPPPPAVDQYGNTLDQYGNPVAGPNGGPVMGPYGPMQLAPGAPAQVPLYGVPASGDTAATGNDPGIFGAPLYGVPPELLDPQSQDSAIAGAVSEGVDGVRRVVRGRPCKRCQGAG